MGICAQRAEKGRQLLLNRSESIKMHSLQLNNVRQYGGMLCPKNYEQSAYNTIIKRGTEK